MKNSLLELISTTQMNVILQLYFVFIIMREIVGLDEFVETFRAKCLQVSTDFCFVNLCSVNLY